MKLDTLIETGPTAVPQFSIESFKTLLVALVVNKREIDVDLLLMLKDEVRRSSAATLQVNLPDVLVL
jgi:hypothetical protein